MNTPTKPAIIGSLHLVSSKPDRNGNTYGAFSYTDTMTGKTVAASVNSARNAESIPYWLNGGNYEPRNVFVTESRLGIREFERYAKGLPYAGCVGEDLAKWIVAALAAN